MTAGPRTSDGTTPGGKAGTFPSRALDAPRVRGALA